MSESLAITISTLDVEATSDGENLEIWNLIKDLSGSNPKVLAVTRQ